MRSLPVVRPEGRWGRFMALAALVLLLVPAQAFALGKSRPEPPPVFDAPAGGHVRVVSYNVWGLPSPLTVRPSRFPKIAESLPDLKADVVGFQETFSRKTRVLEQIEGYPYLARGPQKGKGKILSSGLLILSRYPIVESATVRYSRCSGFDCFAAKGAVMARIDLPWAGEIDVYDTHLNAGGKDRIRDSQVMELMMFMVKHSTNRPVVLIGDFNTKEGSALYEDLAGIYGMRDAHDEYRLSGVHLDPVQWFGFTMDTYRNSNMKFAKLFVKPRRIDFAWLSDGGGVHLRAAETRLVYDWEVDGKHLSDHFGVMADVEVTGP